MRLNWAVLGTHRCPHGQPPCHITEVPWHRISQRLHGNLPKSSVPRRCLSSAHTVRAQPQTVVQPSSTAATRPPNKRRVSFRNLDVPKPLMPLPAPPAPTSATTKAHAPTGATAFFDMPNYIKPCFVVPLHACAPRGRLRA
jgi:hypothetical protein